jgi:hypothetical protein
VVRAPPSDDLARKYEKLPEPELKVLLPAGFLRQTKDSGLVVKSWAPQQEVLAEFLFWYFLINIREINLINFFPNLISTEVQDEPLLIDHYTHMYFWIEIYIWIFWTTLAEFDSMVI